MQRSLVRLITRLAVCMGLAYVLTGAPTLAAQPVTVTVATLKHSASDPGGTTFVPVTRVRAGDLFMYRFDIKPINDPTTPITLTATFDKRLEVYTIGTDGSCIGLYDSIYTLTCRDQRPGIVVARMTTLWVWFVAKSTIDRSPLKMMVRTANDAKTIVIPFDGRRSIYLPIVKR